MLDAFIIEQIRRRERAEKDDRPVLELPLPLGQEEDRRERRGYPEQKEEGERGVIVIDM